VIRSRSALSLIRAAAPAALAVLVIVNFAGYALFGANGLLAWGDYRHRMVERSQQLQALQAQQAVLAHRVALLDPRKVDPDYADELVRRETGQVRPDEVILQIR
jgi:cell division protein FtsB